MRVGVVGPHTWFCNHFPEGWADDNDALCLDVQHGNYDNLRLLQNFRPDVTLFYRPELYPRRLIEEVPGFRVAFLSEPLPALRYGVLEHTAETDLRMRVYHAMQWTSFHWRVFYDASRETSAMMIGFPIDEYRPLPIDTSLFNPEQRPEPEWDVVFVGKPSPHRIEVLDFLRVANLKFLWIAHGCTGLALASLFRRARMVLNLHADSMPQLEPRIYLGAATGALVLSEPLPDCPRHFRGRIVELPVPWTEQSIKGLIERDGSVFSPPVLRSDLADLSVRRFLSQLMHRVQPRIIARGVS